MNTTNKTLGTLAIATALLLTGCTSQGDPMPSPSQATKPAIPSISPTSNAPVIGDISKIPATDTEAIATGGAAFSDYLRVFSLILNDGGNKPERIFDVSSAAGGQVVNSAASYRKMKQHSTGAFSFSVLSSSVTIGVDSKSKDLGPRSKVDLKVCLNASALRDFTDDKKEVVRKGPQKIIKSVSTQWSPTQKRWIVTTVTIPDDKAVPC